jgi:hypothetical protein
LYASDGDDYGLGSRRYLGDYEVDLHQTDYAWGDAGELDEGGLASDGGAEGQQSERERGYRRAF